MTTMRARERTGPTAEPTARPVPQRGWERLAARRRTVLGSASGAAVLAACGPVGGAASPQASKEVVTIEWSHATEPAFQGTMPKNIQLFEEHYPHVKVKELDESGLGGTGQTQKVLTQIAAGGAPDATYFTTKQMPSYTSSRALLELDAYFNRDRIFDRGDFFPATLEYGEEGGKHYGAPYYMGTVVQYFNRSLLERYGIGLPSQYEREGRWTFDTYLTVLKQATAGTGEARTWGLGGVSGSGVDVSYSWLWPLGGAVWDKEMRTSLVTSEGTVAAVQWMADLRLKHQVVPTPDEARQLPPGGFPSGRVAFVAVVRGNRALMPSADAPAFNLGMVPYAKGPAGRITRGTPFLAGILRLSKHVQETWEWIKFMTAVPAQRNWLEKQLTLPSRKSIMQSPDFQRSLLPWESGEAYQESLRTLRVTKLPPRAPDIDTVWQKALDEVFSGQKSAPTAMAEIKPVIDSLLAQRN